MAALRSAQAFQRRQADGDLDEESSHQGGGQHNEGRRKVTDVLANGNFHIAMVFRHHGAKGPPVRIGDRANDGDGELAAGPLEFFLPQLAIACLFGQGQRCIPQ
ncbi:hypothetical protein [Mesorhizobium sp.]|uniref:hypothetical protein n=1 Tax=Mesorhizobium sp. TaxID=1871066 RepID=UPI0025ED6830|nr:hypothetical protein [Mesorhizobium sp.]